MNLFVYQLLAQIPGGPQAPERLPHPDLPAPAQIVPGLSWWGYAGVALVIIALLGLLLSLIFGKKTAPAPEPKRPLVTALRAMKDLRNKADVIAPADVGHRVSEILRTYYLDRYGIPAPFKTTEELFPHATRNDEPLRRRMWRERFESLAELYDSLAYMPPAFSKNDALTLVENTISKLEEERLHENTLAV